MEVLRKSLSGELYRDGGTAKDIRSFSEKFLAEQPGDDSDAALANAIASTQKKYLDRLRTQNTVDGKPPLIDDGFGEYLLWIALGYTRLPYEIVITNQLIEPARTTIGSFDRNSHQIARVTRIGSRSQER